jgi:hypothetical protein
MGRLLRLRELHSVYHGEQSTAGLKHLVHAYERLTADATRAMNRIKALYRGRGIGCRGRAVYEKSKRDEWVRKLEIEGIKVRAGYLYEQLELLLKLSDEASKEMCREARRHSAYKLISQYQGWGQ